MPPHTTRVKALPLTLRAAFQPASTNAEARTVDVVWSTGAKVLRETWFGDKYMEELSLDPRHVRLERLNNSAPLLDSHANYSTRSVLGVVEPGSARLDGDRATATIRFPREGVSPDADRAFALVADGVLVNLSVGYRTYKVEESTGAAGEVPVRRVVDWEPYELSLVPMGADDGAKTRGADLTPNDVELIVRAPAGKEPDVTEEERQKVEQDAQQRGAEMERARQDGIRGLMTALRRNNPTLTVEFERDLVGRGVSVDEARKAITDKLAAEDERAPTSQHTGVIVGRDIGRDTFRRDAEAALLHRIHPSRHPLPEDARRFRGLTVFELAREAARTAGHDVEGMSKREVVSAALDRRAMSTSDFPIILGNVAGATLRAAYEATPATYKAIGRQSNLPDFKLVTRAQLGEAPELKKVVEGGEYTRGTIGEGKEQYKLSTYGRIVAFTRQAIINDDMSAFSRLIDQFGRAARSLEGDLVWSQITANAAMGDGTALFHSNHGNLAGTAAVISVTSVGAGRAAMRSQKGLDKKQFISVAPAYLVVPAALETTADQFVSTAMLAATDATKNPFAGRLTVIAEPRLDANSVISWYLAGDPSAIDIVEYGFLDGEEGPYIETREGFEVDGLEIKCRHDFAAKVIDWRGLYKNAGA